ncbi:MAG TPA: LEA type 2 family protein [Myxococcaceae bacterium]|jgi:LEA14-like dessication related protein
MRKVLFLAAVLVVVASPFAGCAELKKTLKNAFQLPTLTFKTVSLADVSLESATVNLAFQLKNPNPIGLSVSSVSYSFFVEGKQVVAGSPPNGLTIPSSGSRELVFPANVKFADVAPVLQTFLTKETATYRAEGSIGLKTPIGVLPIELKQEGTFPVPKPPQVALQPPRLKAVTLTSATLELPLVVTNPNEFGLPVNGLSGTVIVAGSKVGTVASQDFGYIAPHAQQPVNLDVVVNFAQAAAAAGALRKGQATVAFDAEIRSGKLTLPLRLEKGLAP